MANFLLSMFIRIKAPQIINVYKDQSISDNVTSLGAVSFPMYRMQQLYGLEEDKAVASWEILLERSEKNLADAVIVATQDKVGGRELQREQRIKTITNTANMPNIPI